MVKSELIQKLCDMHPNMLRKDIEKIVEIIFESVFGIFGKTKGISKKNSKP